MKNPADASKLKEDFSTRVCSIYNEETFFVKSCNTKSSKYSRDTQIKDLSLEIYFAENNLIDICGRMVPFCSGRRIALSPILNDDFALNLTVENNYYVTQKDVWEESDFSCLQK